MDDDSMLALGALFGVLFGFFLFLIFFFGIIKAHEIKSKTRILKPTKIEIINNDTTYYFRRSDQ